MYGNMLHIIISGAKMKSVKMSEDGSFHHMEIAERYSVGVGLITLYSALSVVLSRDVNCGSV